MEGLWPINMKVDWTPLVQNVADIVSSMHKGVAKLVDLWVGQKCAEALRDRLLRDAQNHADSRAIADGAKRYENGVLMDRVELCDQQNLWSFLSDRIRDDEVANLIKALARVSKLLEGLSENFVKDEDVSKTFFNRWRKEVELIDDEKLREIWAKIMAQEIVQPGTISLRTMDVVRNLSSDEAHLFQRMVKGEIEGVIPIDGEGHPQYVHYVDALKLQNAGLIFAQESRRTFGLKYENDSTDNGTAIVLSDVGLVACVRQKEYSVKCYILTDAGRCLLRIAQGVRSLKDFIMVFDRLAKQSNQSVISLHRMVQNNAKGASWERIPLWTNKSKMKPSSESREEKKNG